MNALFTGVGVALVTPFTHDGVDLPLLGRLIDRQLEAGVDALIVLGTTGEPSTMEETERAQVIGYAVQRVKGRVPVIAGAGSNNTRAAVRNARVARDEGADGLLVVTPYYNKCTQDGLVAHFARVADETALPVIVYNVPSRTGVNMLSGTAKEVCAHPRIVGLKEAVTDMVQLGDAVRLLGDCPVYSGNDDLCLPALALGAQGLISVAANVVPEQIVSLVKGYMAGDGKGALITAQCLSRLIALLFLCVSPIPCKEALCILGYGDGRVRLPLTRMERAGAQELRLELEKLGVK